MARINYTTSKISSTKQNTKNNGFHVGRRAHAVKISIFKGFLHNCGRVGISFRQLKKIKQNNRMYATFPKSQKNT